MGAWGKVVERVLEKCEASVRRLEGCFQPVDGLGEAPGHFLSYLCRMGTEWRTDMRVQP